MTLEDLEAHLKKANLDQYVKPQAAVAGAQQDLGDVLKSVCGVFKGIRPILSAVVNIPLIPGFIKNALKTFMQVMDGICPQ